MKRLIAILFTTMLAGQAFAYDFQSGDLYYNITSNTEPYAVEVTYPVYCYGNMVSGYTKELGELEIPETVDYNDKTYTITRIGDYAFEYCDGLTSVKIPNTVKSIGNWAFDWINTLTTVVIGDAVESIGQNAFYNCSILKSINIPNTVTEISDYAFYGCNSLTFNEYGNACYLGSINNQYMLLVKAKNTDIASCEINSNCKYIAEYAFNSCGNLASIIIPDGVENIGDYAFGDCSYMTSVTIPESVTKIGSSAFWNCHNIIPLTIPSTVSEIGWGAFGRVKNVIYTGSATGSPWEALNINGEPDENGFIYGDEEKTQLTAYVGNGGDVIIPNTVTVIGNQSFGRCVGLTSVIIGNNVTNIGDEAFNYCNNLTAISIAKSVTSISGSAFVGSNNIFNEFGNALYLGNSENQYLFLIRAKNTDIASCEINSNCKYITEYAFSNCDNLTTITIPDGVETLGNGVFGWCHNLTSVTIGNSVKKISNSVFGDCFSLTTVNIPESVTKIEMYAFNNCGRLKIVTIPNTVVEIGEAFYGCDNATLYCQAQSKPEGYGDLESYVKSVEWNCKTVDVSTNNAKYGTVETTGNYTVKTANGSLWYLANTEIPYVTLIATPNEGYHFVKWSDDNTEPTRTIAVTESGNYTAEFAINVYTVTTLAENGLVVGGGTYTHGKQATLIATPSIRYQFLCWNDVVTENPRTITVTKDTTFTAVFEPKTVVDTIKIEVPVIVHDTVKIEVLVRDTIKTIEHDTIRVEVVKNDTIYKTDTVKYYSGVKLVHDTIFVTKPDTIYVFKDVKFVHDTIYVTKTDTVYLQTAVSEMNAIGLKVYPNPTVSFVTVDADADFSYVLTDINGKLLRKEDNAVSYLLDLSEYPDGVYLLNTSDGATHKIVKK